MRDQKIQHYACTWGNVKIMSNIGNPNSRFVFCCEASNIGARSYYEVGEGKAKGARLAIKFQLWMEDVHQCMSFDNVYLMYL